jgi:F-type H+-transporting ATPase subunit delta
MNVIVTTAVELTAAQKKLVREIATEKLGTKEFELQEKLDPTIVGGVRLTLGSRQYDASVVGAFQRLQSFQAEE